MNTPSFLQDLDPEVLQRVRLSRREALAKASRAGLGAAVLSSLPVAFALSAREAFGQASPQQVVTVLNFALALEYLEDEFYRTGLATPALTAQFGGANNRDRNYIEIISQHETAHVALLKAALGSAAIAKPTFDFTAGGTFPTVFTSRDTFFAVGLAFEDTGVRAYKGQAPNLMGAANVTFTPPGASAPISVNPLTTALQIHAIEARHAAAMRRATVQTSPKGWVSGNTAHAPGTAPVYAGEENTTHAGVNLSTLATAAGFTLAQATESYDEPLTRAQVVAIANLFIVSPKLT